MSQEQHFLGDITFQFCTLENWESGKSKCPEYVRELLERAVKEDVK